MHAHSPSIEERRLEMSAMSGTIIVDGVAASVYIDFLGGEATAHRSAAKYRLASRFAPRLVRWLHDRGLNQPLLLFMAQALPEVRNQIQRKRCSRC